MVEDVLLLAPSSGLGGGIERYAETIEAVFRRHGVRYLRLNLVTPERPHGTPGKLRYVRMVRRQIRASTRPTRLVLTHSNLLPVLRFVNRSSAYCGATVILHGSEIWSGPSVRHRRMLRRSDVRAVAVSNFSAGALTRICPSNVLNPGVSPEWYQALVDAAEGPSCALPDDPSRASEVRLITAFRLAGWREKGLPTVLDAVRRTGDDRIRLTVCGTGPVPDELLREVAAHPCCRLAPDLADADLARRLASADLCVLATRTRPGAHAHGEGFGLILLEAQLAGTPVVAPAYGGSGEAFLPGVTGMAPSDETPEALATVLVTLLRDEQRRQMMGRAAAYWSRLRFAPEVYGPHLIRTLLSDAGAGVHPTPDSVSELIDRA